MKTTVEFNFNFGDKVWVIELACYGRVLSCWYTRSGKQYEVRYFHNGEHLTTYIFEEELSDKKL
jgi:capsid portal protein